MEYGCALAVAKGINYGDIFITIIRRILKIMTQRSLTVSLMVFVLTIMISAAFIHHEFARIRDNMKQQAFVHLLTLGARLEGTINSHLVVLQGLKAEIAINADITQDEVAVLVEEYLQRQESISHIALAPNLIIKYIYPLAGNESALGADYRQIPEQLRSVQKSIDENVMILDGPVKLIQGGRALIARVPVFYGKERNQLWGVISGVIDPDALFKRAGIASSMWDLDIAIQGQKNDQGTAIFFGDAAVFDHDPVIVDVQLPYGQWHLAAGPRNGWQVDDNKVLLFWSLSLLVSFLFAMGAYLIAFNYRQKLMAIETANYRANYDELTGLSNRSYFTYEFNSSIKEHKRKGQRFAVFFIDLDYFKEVNDNWGHFAGDELLKQFASRMNYIVRSDNITARLAGDEFVIILHNIESVMQVEILAEKLQSELGEPYHIDGQYLSVTHSLGIAIYPQDGQTLDQLLQNADRAMYAAKRAGKNCIYFYNENLSKEVKKHVQVHNEILAGIRDGQFELYLQPILTLNNNQIAKCEALIRWNHPDKGMVSPAEFIPIAEQTGAIRALGDWVLAEACQLSNRLSAQNINIKITVNRSVAEFYPKDAVKGWLAIIERSGVKHQNLVFEITESLLMEGGDSQLEAIQQLREQGIVFAIDDFGTGYSAINYLRHYPVDYLKIDRCFVTDIIDDEQDRTLVEVIIKMGQTLGIEVIAEGVETKEELALLASFHCDYAQGFYIGKPMSYDNFLSFYQSR
jgi:diguanylate cyclase (GGDEF)-like protein